MAELLNNLISIAEGATVKLGSSIGSFTSRQTPLKNIKSPGGPP